MPQAARSTRAVDPSLRALRALRLGKSFHREGCCADLSAEALGWRKPAGRKPAMRDEIGELAERQGIAVLTRRDRKVAQVRSLHSPPRTSKQATAHGVCRTQSRG
jgi:hypothetical protein